MTKVNEMLRPNDSKAEFFIFFFDMPTAFFVVCESSLLSSIIFDLLYIFSSSMKLGLPSQFLSELKVENTGVFNCDSEIFVSSFVKNTFS